jgi:hypothetical protein
MTQRGPAESGHNRGRLSRRPREAVSRGGARRRGMAFCPSVVPKLSHGRGRYLATPARLAGTMEVARRLLAGLDQRAPAAALAALWPPPSQAIDRTSTCVSNKLPIRRAGKRLLRPDLDPCNSAQPCRAAIAGIASHALAAGGNTGRIHSFIQARPPSVFCRSDDNERLSF